VFNYFVFDNITHDKNSSVRKKLQIFKVKQENKEYEKLKTKECNLLTRGPRGLYLSPGFHKSIGLCWVF